MTRKIILSMLIAFMLLSLAMPIFASLDPNGTTEITGEPQDRLIVPISISLDPDAEQETAGDGQIVPTNEPIIPINEPIEPITESLVTGGLLSTVQTIGLIIGFFVFLTVAALLISYKQKR
jgi:hypothetical protein